MDFICESRKTPILGRYDVIVVAVRALAGQSTAGSSLRQNGANAREPHFSDSANYICKYLLSYRRDFAYQSMFFYRFPQKIRCDSSVTSTAKILTSDGRHTLLPPSFPLKSAGPGQKCPGPADYKGELYYPLHFS